jgi:hypothetical protein
MSTPENGDEFRLRRPIIIIGAPRSGTNLLMNLLGSHRRLAAISEPRIIWRFGNDARSDLLRPEHARPEVRRHIRARFARMVRERERERFVEKTPSNALRPGFVDAVFPDCRFVNITRHGADAVLSVRDAWQRRSGVRGFRRQRWLNRLRELEPRQAPRYALELVRRALPSVAGRGEWGPRLPGMQALIRELSPLELACLQWRFCVELASHYGRRLPRERYFEVRLEDLSRERMQAILDFCELDDDPALWAAFDERFDASQAGRRRDKATPEELDVLRTWIEPTLRWLGYEL